MSLTQYIFALSQADWFYDYADDSRAHAKGDAQIAGLRATAERSDDDHKIAFNQAFSNAFPDTAPEYYPFPGLPNKFPPPTTEPDGTTKNKATAKHTNMKSAIAIITVILTALIQAGKSLLPELKALAEGGGEEAPAPTKKKPVAEEEDAPPAPAKKKKPVAEEEDAPPAPAKKKSLVDDDDDDTGDVEVTFPMIKAALKPLMDADIALADKNKKEIHVSRVFDLLAGAPYKVDKVSALKPAHYARFMKDVAALVEGI